MLPFFSSLLSSLLYIIAIMCQKGFRKSYGRFSRIFQGFTYKYERLGKFQRENMCGKFSRKKNRKAPNKKQTCRKNRKKLNTIRQNKIRVKCPCRLKSAISRLNDRNPLFMTFRHKKFSAKCLFASLM